MNNLIVTIIGIALTAIAAVMGIFYGGTAFENAQFNALASTIQSEAQQILTAERMWAVNNNQPDISGMGTAGTSGTGMSMLVNSKTLAEWPAFGGTLGVSGSLTNPGPQPLVGASNAPGTVATGTSDDGCYSINGYAGYFYRTMFSYNSGNYVMYSFAINVPYTAPCRTQTGNFVSSTTDISQLNHPIVKIAKAINAALNQIPANANKATMPYIGLPAPPAGSTRGTANPSLFYSTDSGNALNGIVMDSSNMLQTNYCYFVWPSVGPPYDWISCVFGPS